MPAKAERKDHPISMRLPEADIAMIDRDAAVRAAEGVVMEQRLIRMSPEGFSAFLSILAAPAEAVAEMVEVVRRPAPWEPGYIPRR